MPVTQVEADGTERAIDRQNDIFSDISNLHQRFLERLSGSPTEPKSSLPKGAVVVAENLTFLDILNYWRNGARAFILDARKFGATSHLIIVSQALKIPVVLIKDPLGNLKADDKVTVDSREGTVILNPSRHTQKHSQQKLAAYNLLEQAIQREPYAGQVKTLDGTVIHLAANTQALADLESVKTSGTREINLHRSEIWYMKRTQPQLEELVRWIKRMAKDQQRFVFRLLDVGGDKVPSYLQETIGSKRGLIFLLETREGQAILQTQLSAMLIATEELRQQGSKPDLEILIPMVTEQGGVLSIRKMLGEIRQRLISENQIDPSINLPISIMVETPASITNIESLAQAGVRVFRIGSNDLTIAELGINREELMKGPHADWLNPTVLKALNRVVEVGEKCGTSVSLCGEMAREPLAAIVLVMLGIKNLSMNPTYIPQINYLLKHLDFSQIGWQTLKQQILQAENAIAVRNAVYNFLRNIPHAPTKHIVDTFIPSPYPPGYSVPSETI